MFPSVVLTFILLIFIFLLFWSNNSISVIPTFFLFPQLDIIPITKEYPFEIISSLFSSISLIVKGPSINLFLMQSMFEYCITFVFIVLFGLKEDKVFPLMLFAL